MYSTDHANEGEEVRISVRPENMEVSVNPPSSGNVIHCRVVDVRRRVEGNVLHIQDVDIVNETPLLDIKPYAPEFDVRAVEKTGWLEKNARRSSEFRDDGRFVEYLRLNLINDINQKIKSQKNSAMLTCLLVSLSNRDFISTSISFSLCLM